MKPEERDERMVKMVKEHLDAGVDALDDLTAARLRAVRLKAVESAEGKRGWLRFPRWVAVGGLATAAAAVLAVGLWVSGPRESTVATADDIEIVAAQEQMQFYEDIEFYRWLAAQENGG